MAACVFVEKGVVEQNAQLSDRVVIADHGDFAEAVTAFVGFDYAFECFVAFFGRKVGYSTVFKR